VQEDAEEAPERAEFLTGAVLGATDTKRRVFRTVATGKRIIADKAWEVTRATGVEATLDGDANASSTIPLDGDVDDEAPTACSTGLPLATRRFSTYKGRQRESSRIIVASCREARALPDVREGSPLRGAAA